MESDPKQLAPKLNDTIRARCDDGLRERVNEYCAMHRRNEAWVVRTAVMEFLERHCGRETGAAGQVRKAHPEQLPVKPAPDVLTIPEAARELRVHVDTVRRHIRAHRLKVISHGYRTKRIRMIDLEAFLQRNLV